MDLYEDWCYRIFWPPEYESGIIFKMNVAIWDLPTPLEYRSPERIKIVKSTGIESEILFSQMANLANDYFSDGNKHPNVFYPTKPRKYLASREIKQAFTELLFR